MIHGPSEEPGHALTKASAHLTALRNETFSSEDAFGIGRTENIDVVYTLLIHDDRYSAPSLYLLTVTDDDHAGALAQARLVESPHHQGVEL